MRQLIHSARHLLRFALSSLTGALIVILIVAVVMLNNKPNLNVWHRVELVEEFRSDAGLADFWEYLALEDRLFETLDKSVYQPGTGKSQRSVNRYQRGSLADPGRWPVNWNRSFVMSGDEPTASVLLLHGMSDSPYSMRSIGQTLKARGASVIGLRIPGHGLAPSGLLDVEWEDMAAAVRLAMLHLDAGRGDSPLYIVGYSNGGALAVQYALDSLSDNSLPAVDGLVLISPEIGISKMAALAVWLERIGHLFGLEKLAWNDVLPEYDPWKYGSFALNAGKQAYRITEQIQQQITSQAKAGNLDRMPPILAFQSVVDATVTAPALVSHLFDRLPRAGQLNDNATKRGHELVLFDINRFAPIKPLMKADPAAWIEPMLHRTDLTFHLSLLSNNHIEDKQLVAASRMPGSPDIEVCDTGMVWPDHVYSLSHVALPFPPDDPVYGTDPSRSPGIYLGKVALLGERNVLQVPAASMLRLRANPFYAYLEQRLLTFMGFEEITDSTCLPLP